MDRVQRIGVEIRAARRRYKLTQVQLADLAETSARTVRDIEHGTGTTNIGTVAEVADVLGLTLGVSE